MTSASPFAAADVRSGDVIETLGRLCPVPSVRHVPAHPAEYAQAWTINTTDSHNERTLTGLGHWQPIQLRCAVLRKVLRHPLERIGESMNEIPGNSPNARCHLRIARPTADLQLAERFWVGGVGMEVLWRTPDNLDQGHQLLMVGWRAATWHIELVCDKAYAALNSPSERTYWWCISQRPSTP